MNKHYKKNRHSYYDLNYHLVVATKYGYKTINGDIFVELKNIVENIFNEKWNCTVLDITTEGNNIHIIFGAPPQVQLSKLINNFKTVSSRLIRKKFEKHINNFYEGSYFWNDNYLILSIGGERLGVPEKYMKTQAATP